MNVKGPVRINVTIPDDEYDNTNAAVEFFTIGVLLILIFIIV